MQMAQHISRQLKTLWFYPQSSPWWKISPPKSIDAAQIVDLITVSPDLTQSIGLIGGNPWKKFNFKAFCYPEFSKMILSYWLHNFFSTTWFSNTHDRAQHIRPKRRSNDDKRSLDEITPNAVNLLPQLKTFTLSHQSLFEQIVSLIQKCLTQFSSVMSL